LNAKFGTLGSGDLRDRFLPNFSRPSPPNPHPTTGGRQDLFIFYLRLKDQSFSKLKVDFKSFLKICRASYRVETLKNQNKRILELFQVFFDFSHNSPLQPIF
jgi:hypothetical protein